MYCWLWKLISVKFSDKQEERMKNAYLKVPVKLKKQNIELLSPKNKYTSAYNSG